MLQAKGSFTLVLSGGSLLKALANLIDIPGVDFSKWHIAFADERNVPHSSDDSTYKGAQDVFLSKVWSQQPTRANCLSCNASHGVCHTSHGVCHNFRMQRGLYVWWKLCHAETAAS